MKKRGDACGCIHRFLSHFPALKLSQLGGLRYEDDVCRVECDGRIIRAYAYEITSGVKYKIRECIMTIW